MIATIEPAPMETDRLARTGPSTRSEPPAEPLSIPIPSPFTPVSGKRSRAIGYIRVSTEDQAETGHSLDAQRSKIGAYATIHDLDLVRVIADDGRSAKTLDRPGMAEILTIIDRRRADCVIVAKLDRLTRSVRDLGDLIERFDKAGVQFASVADNIDTSTASGRLVLNVMGSVAQWEREIIAERTTEALHHMRANGQRVGRYAHYGYRLDEAGELVEDESEKAGIRLMLELRANGIGLNRIAKELQRRGFTGRSGQRLAVSTIHQIIKRESK